MNSNPDSVTCELCNIILITKPLCSLTLHLLKKEVVQLIILITVPLLSALLSISMANELIQPLLGPIAAVD